MDNGFEQVDFVYEPGQYSLRGGIVDVFSYAESRPFRIDFFGYEIDSIRQFNISSQLSHDKVQSVEIIPNLNVENVVKVSLAEFSAEATYWFYDADYVLKKVNDLRHRVLAELEEPSQIDTLMTSRNGLLRDMAQSRVCLLRDNLKERIADVTVKFNKSVDSPYTAYIRYKFGTTGTEYYAVANVTNSILRGSVTIEDDGYEKVVNASNIINFIDNIG